MPSDSPESFDFFFYGTLLVPAILGRVLGRDASDLKFQDAVLDGYTRHHVKGEDYPTIIDEKGLKGLGVDAAELSADDRLTRGTVVSGLTRQDVDLLDVFEGSEYKRIQAPVQTLTNPRTLADLPPALARPEQRASALSSDASSWGKATAWVYIWNAPIERVDPAIWNVDAFLRDKADVWTTLGDEYADVDAARSQIAAGGAVAGGAAVEGGEFSSDADGLVGKTVPGFPDFGHNMLKEWSFRPGYVNLNHGSYGSTPNDVRIARDKLGDHIEGAPDAFNRLEVEKLIAKSREAVAPLINADADDVVLVPNATHGVNTVISNTDWVDGDIIVVYATTYNAISQTAKYTCDRNPGIRLEIIQLTFPTTHAEIVEKTEALFKKYNQKAKGPRGDSVPNAVAVDGKERVRMVVIDSIASNPGVIYPWEKVVSLAHEYDVLSLVDAAHSIGQHRVDLKKTDPDFWVSNCHKWLMSHRSVAILYVPKRNQRIIRSSYPTGHYYESERYPTTTGHVHPWNFLNQFHWNGTQDFSPVVTVVDTVAFRKKIGGEDRIIAYNHSLAVAGGKRLAKRWNTVLMENDAGELTAAMVNVELPGLPPAVPSEEGRMAKIFYEEFQSHNCWAAVYVHDNKWWTRLSAQVWNELSDFDAVAKAFESVAERVKRGELQQ
ncbi:hypothetical protein Q8F55_000206 [Vanrija albida]|uniref:Aminotransferase class V domain-containing protein n=1 Tax=Vanrija albida TaxID=181172 RepID=A0ABR3QCL5_9TREE